MVMFVCMNACCCGFEKVPAVNKMGEGVPYIV
jgi:hypothetical protein